MSSTREKDQSISERPLKGSHHGISVMSLDAIKPTEKLSPGEPHKLALGVTISILQSAAEALLEVEEMAQGSISVDNQPAAELATVRPGQVIKTKEGRYVLIRHLQAIIVPREKGYERPVHVDQMIQLAVASLEASEMETMNVTVDGRIDNAKSKPSRIRLIVLGVAAAAVISLCFLPMGADESKAKPSQNGKSRVIAAAELTQAADTPAGTAASTEKAAPELAVQVPQPAVPVAVKPAVIDSPKKAKPGQSASVKVVPVAGKGVQLSEKDRQTIVEYRLEAKFDRTSARNKLKDFAKSFPVGSPARGEVERSLGGI